MPVKVWKTKDGRFAAQWGDSGKIYRSKNRAAAKAKAARQGRAAFASGYREHD